MTGFDRVAAALEHKEPDRVPLDFGAAEVAAINIHTMRRLRRFLGMSEDVTLQDIITQTAKMQDDLIERLQKSKALGSLIERIGIVSEEDGKLDEKTVTLYGIECRFKIRT